MPLKILLAEDHSTNQRVAKLMLANTGHLLDIVPNGQAAVEACAERDYDVVLMDCLMPVMDGVDAASHIKSSGGHQPVIIAVTADAIKGRREYYLSMGMDNYVSKPYTKNQLLAIIEDTLRSRLQSPSCPDSR